MQLDLEELMPSPEASPASHTATRESAAERRTTAISGRKCLALSKHAGPLGSLVKMLLASEQWFSSAVKLKWKAESVAARRKVLIIRRFLYERKSCYSEMCVTTSVRSVTPSSHLLFRLVPSMPCTDETESGLLHTPTGKANQLSPSMVTRDAGSWGMWPTPHGFSKDGKSNGPSGNELGRAVNERLWQTPVSDDAIDREAGKFNSRGEPKLSAQVKLWPTMTARDSRSIKGAARVPNSQGTEPLTVQIGEMENAANGSLNPQWVEWLMGYPEGWTDLDR